MPSHHEQLKAALTLTSTVTALHKGRQICYRTITTSAMLSTSCSMFTRFPRALWPVVLLWNLAYSTCYFRDGSVDLRSGIQRCDSILQHNMCCWLNAYPAYPDICTPQGLCVSNTTEEPSQLYVDSCADPKWSLGCSPLAEFCSKITGCSRPLRSPR